MNWHYLAGFFDGEGTITIRGKRCRVAITQTNKEILEEIRDFVGYGYVVEVKKRKPHWKDCWIYFISRKADMLHFFKNVYPFLILKKELAGDAIVQIEKDLIILQERIDKASKNRKMAKLLREKNFSYREIGKELCIDWGYARRLVLDLKS